MGVVASPWLFGEGKEGSYFWIEEKKPSKRTGNKEGSNGTHGACGGGACGGHSHDGSCGSCGSCGGCGSS